MDQLLGMFKKPDKGHAISRCIADNAVERTFWKNMAMAFCPWPTTTAAIIPRGHCIS